MKLHYLLGLIILLQAPTAFSRELPDMERDPAIASALMGEGDAYNLSIEARNLVNAYRLAYFDLQGSSRRLMDMSKTKKMDLFDRLDGLAKEVREKSQKLEVADQALQEFGAKVLKIEDKKLLDSRSPEIAYALYRSLGGKEEPMGVLGIFDELSEDFDNGQALMGEAWKKLGYSASDAYPASATAKRTSRILAGSNGNFWKTGEMAQYWSGDLNDFPRVSDVVTEVLKGQNKKASRGVNIEFGEANIIEGHNKMPPEELFQNREARLGWDLINGKTDKEIRDLFLKSGLSEEEARCFMKDGSCRAAAAKALGTGRDAAPKTEDPKSPTSQPTEDKGDFLAK